MTRLVRTCATAVVVSLYAAAGAWGQTESQGPTALSPAPHIRVVTNPNWITRPTASDLAPYYPVEAKAGGISGRATINCEVKATGHLEGCKVMSETPPDAGFGEAALAATGILKVRPKQIDTVPTDGGRVTIPLEWQP